MDLLKKIELQDADATYIFVGDLIDRGKNVWEILTWAMEHITIDGKYQCVRGNHEQMAIEWWKEYRYWYENSIKMGDCFGNEPPVSAYDISNVLYSNILPTGVNGYHSLEDFEPFIQFFESLPYSKKLETVSIAGKSVIFRIVHANYNYSLPEHSSRQYDENLYARNYWGAKNNDSDEDIVVIGHTPTFIREFNLRYSQDRPGLICYRHNLINVDCGCVFGDDGFHAMEARCSPCMLGAICLETLDEIYPYTLEERFKAIASKVCQLPIEEKLFSNMTVEEYFKLCMEQYLKQYGMHTSETNIYRKEMCVRLGIG